MPFNGSGVYTAPAADFPVVTQTVISSTHYNNVVNDIATGLSLCLTKDGQQTATANIPFGGFRATNVGITAIAGSVGTPAINVSDAGTGLYRSAASELAVTVAGSQVARFASTGLIVTGAASVSTTLTATTSVVTPLVGPATNVQFNFQQNGTIYWAIQGGGTFIPAADNTTSFGAATNRIASVFTPIIDSGTTGSLSLRTNNGKQQALFANAGDGTNFLGIQGAATTFGPVVFANGTDTNIPLEIVSKGSGTISFSTAAGYSGDINNARTNQFQVLHTASATRNITITGSNGGNPTISTTAGNLAITPAVVIAGTSLTVDTSAAVASAGTIRLPNTGSILARNAANSGDVSMAQMQTINGAADIIVVGGGGLVAVARSGGAAPTTSDLANGRWAVWRDTGGGTTKLYYNNAGAIQSVALA